VPPCPNTTDMTIYVFPQLGSLLRSLITSAGYRRRITDFGLDKDLDDLASDSRPGSSCDLMQQIEDAVQRDMAVDCGVHWAQFFRLAWHKTRDAIQQSVRLVDTGPIAVDSGREVVRLGFEVPMLSGLVRLVAHQHPGMDIESWWTSPVAAWVKLAANLAKLTESEAVSRLHETPRTTERWMAGEPTRELQWPFRPTVLQVLGGHSDRKQHSQQDVDQLTGWLTFAVAFQSLAIETRELVRQDYELRRQHPWSMGEFLTKLTQQSLVAGALPVRELAIPLLTRIEQHFSVERRNLDAAQSDLDSFQHLIEQEPPHWRRSYQHIHDWFEGRLAAIQGREASAMAFYAKAVEGVWWFGGPNQLPMLNEALLYAVGVGDSVAAKHYWDKTFMLGLNQWPKRPLDEQERRRLAFSFERMFSPQKARDRIPPPVELILRDTPFELSQEQLKSPNRKVKHAEGRTRRTPLMDAAREGSLSDVKRAIAAGGDTNDFIKESGEGPLTYAMRRACDRGDPVIMDYLLKLDLSKDTVNRQASTSRETPLKIAIEMADAAAVERLIALGADVEQASDYVPSALCYAMLLLHGSIHRTDLTQEAAYLAGKTRADVHDAKDGAALDIELATRRQRRAALRDASPRNRAIFDAVMEHYVRPAEPRRQVVLTLLKYGADANRRYKVEPHHLAEWTPTLFAAQVGDVGIFRSLIEHDGNADLLLMQSSALERYDALWVAVDHGRHAIVDFLVKRASGSRSG
jgi:ankyrin repeat protein